MLLIKGNIQELGEIIRYCQRTAMYGGCDHCPFRDYLSVNLDRKCEVPIEDILVVEEDIEEENE